MTTANDSKVVKIKTASESSRNRTYIIRASTECLDHVGNTPIKTQLRYTLKYKRLYCASLVAEGGIEPLTHFKGHELMRLVSVPTLVTTAMCLYRYQGSNLNPNRMKVVC